MPFWQSVRGFFARSWVHWTLLVLLFLVAGWALSLLLLPAPRIGLITFADVIFPDTVVTLEEQIHYAENDPSIRAVLLEIDSPGGDAAASERLYFDLLRLRAKKPVVVLVDSMAASGGYYMASAADLIYATPSSSVGNIGVISMYPSASFVVEDYLFTGPFKAFGNTRDSFVRQMEVLKDSFLECVFAQRGDRLKYDKETLSRGEIYIGTMGLQIGLVDALGSRSDALAAAAKLAGLRHWEFISVADEMPQEVTPVPTEEPYYDYMSRLNEPSWTPGFYFLYLSPATREPGGRAPLPQAPDAAAGQGGGQ